MEKSISIITVCYNAAHLLAKTVESVIEQTYKNIEYIVVDGNSTDNTNDIIAQYRNKISTYLSEPDSGIFDAMNKGISMAKGDLIIFLNAGDYFGDSALISQKPTTSNAVVASLEARIIVLYAENIDAMLADDPKVALQLLKQMAVNFYGKIEHYSN